MDKLLLDEDESEPDVLKQVPLESSVANFSNATDDRNDNSAKQEEGVLFEKLIPSDSDDSPQTIKEMLLAANTEKPECLPVFDREPELLWKCFVEFKNPKDRRILLKKLREIFAEEIREGNISFKNQAKVSSRFKMIFKGGFLPADYHHRLNNIAECRVSEWAIPLHNDPNILKTPMPQL